MSDEKLCLLFPSEENAVLFVRGVGALEFQHLVCERHSTVVEIDGLEFYFADLIHDLITMAKTVRGDQIPCNWRTHKQ